MEKLTLENSYQQYWSTVKAIAQDIKNERERDETLDTLDLVHGYVDGSSWVIYYWQQKLVLLHTDNLDAIDEVEGVNSPNATKKGQNNMPHHLRPWHRTTSS